MNSTIIFDQNCPMCRFYTKAFVSYNLLEKKERITFEEVNDNEIIRLVDWDKARNEIPFIDNEQKKVYYGVEALLHVLGKKSVFFKWMVKQKLIVQLLKKIYFFISFNRRVIIPGNADTCKFRSAPHFNLKYRSLYILFTWVITAITLTSYSAFLEKFIGITSHGREFLICGGQIIFQLIILSFLKKKKEEIFEYTGNMMSVSFAGAILLLPMLIIGKSVTGLPTETFAFYFLLVAGLMFVEHIRRMRKTGLPSMMSATWVLYRLLVLFIILKF